MANFEDLKKKTKDALGAIADVSVEAYKLAEEKAKVLAKTTKLTAEVSREKAQLKRLHQEVGVMYHNLHKDSPGEAFAQSVAEISATLERIEEKQREIEDLKNGYDIPEDFADADAEPIDEDDE